ncbi:MAG: DUF3108 domain-containing protein [Cyclobacteriaceae bacterium]
MKRIVALTFLMIALSGFTQSDTLKFGDPVIRKTYNFNAGEELYFKLSYGWFTVGRADLQVDPADHTYDNKDCYKIDISGRTAGLLGVFTHVDDKWGAYVSKDDLLPVMAYSDIEEGKYTRKEEIYYDQTNRKIKLHVEKRKKPRKTKYFESATEVYDLLSGFLVIRDIDFGALSIGDTVKFNAFYDQIFYDFGLVYHGVELVNTEVGKLNAYKVVPVLPENKVFPGENPITAWISADNNQLPLKIEANMFFGTAECELTGYKNIKYGPDYID